MGKTDGKTYIKMRYFAACMLFVLMQFFATVQTLFSVDSASAASSASHVATGNNTACGVKSGKVYCWGSNAAGALGVGDGRRYSSTAVPVYAASDGVLYNKYATMVSVGVRHACALADARVYCWGDNSQGELGNGTKTNSRKPVAVDMSNVLKNKEIIDVAAGDNFTCALASDGTIACWGEGNDGRLGVGVGGIVPSSTSKAEPVNLDTDPTVYRQYSRPEKVDVGGALAGKQAIMLARANSKTMCVLAVSGSVSQNAGSPYCWGYGIGEKSLPATTVSRTSCNQLAVPSARGTDVYYRSIVPVKMADSKLFTGVDAQDYVTGLATDKKPYYWGMYGYHQAVTYRIAATCQVNTCTSQTRYLRYVAAPEETDVVLAVTPGHSVSGKVGKTSYSTSVNKAGSSSISTRPGTIAGGGTAGGGGGGSGGSRCTWVNRIAYSATTTYTHDYATIGKKVATAPPATTLTQSSLGEFAGNVFSNLFCATAASGLYCDGNGTSTRNGELGNNLTTQMSGPQAVVNTGWLQGKKITQLSTGVGYTCALAKTGGIACWGKNYLGRLGTGSTGNALVPTAVSGI